MKRICIFLLTAAALLSAVSCKESTQDGTINPVDESSLAPVFTSDGGTLVIEFDATAEWNATVPNTNHYSWSSITPTSGEAGRVQIAVTALPNTEPDGRDYRFTVNCGSQSQQVTVTQLQKDAITYVSGPLDLPKEGGSVEIKIVSNVDYSYEIIGDAKNWITPVSTRGLSESSVSFSVASNEIYNVFESRSGVIRFTSAVGTQDVTVNQAPNERIFEVTSELVAAKEACSVDLAVNANFPYELILDEDCDWAEIGGATDGVHKISVQTNPEFGSRITGITVATGVEDYEAYVTLKQKGTADVQTLWSKSYGDYDLASAGGPLRLAVFQDMLLVAIGGNQLYALNRETGEMIQKVELPAGLSVDSMVSDDAGNLLLAGRTAFGGQFDVYCIEAGTDFTPKLLLSYSHVDIWSSAMGNLRVKGDVTGNAVLTAFVDVSQYWLRWEVKDGVVGASLFGHVDPASSYVWNPYGACVAPVSSDFNDGLLFIGYINDAAGNYDLNHYDPASGSWKSVFHTDSAGNENYNCISVATLNGMRFCAIERGAHFSWGRSPEVYLLDITDLDNVKESYYVDWATVSGGTAFIGSGACSDVLLVLSSDGTVMDMFVTDGNYDCLTCIRFVS